MWINRPNKEQSRRLVAEALANNQFRIKSGLWLPGADALCVRTMKAAGLLEPNGHHLFVEKEHETFLAMQRAVSSLDIDHMSHLGELHHVKSNMRFDWANLDFNGALSPEICNWFHNYLCANLREKHFVSFNFLVAFRNNAFIKRCRDFFFDHPGWVREFKQAFGLRETEQTTYLATVLHCLYWHNYKPYFVRYNDTQAMYVFLLQSIPAADCSYSLMPSEFFEFLRKECHMERTARNPLTEERIVKQVTSPAQKAWETRRRRAKKRSEAAKKAWATRRKLAAI